jgi:hypothetical protein
MPSSSTIIDRREPHWFTHVVNWANKLPAEALEPVAGIGAMGVGLAVILTSVEYKAAPYFLVSFAPTEFITVAWGIAIGAFGWMKVLSYVLRMENLRRVVALLGVFLWTTFTISSWADFRHAAFAAGFCPALALASLFLVFKLGRIERRNGKV